MSIALADAIDTGTRERLLSIRREPLFLANWDEVVFIHYRVQPSILQPEIPFDLDLYDNSAWVSLVAFTMRGMRPRIGGSVGRWLCRPIASHSFLNVRTYIRHRGEPGIYFIAEWLSNWLSVRLGPVIYGLPYRFGGLVYQHSFPRLRGSIRAKEGHFSYRSEMKSVTLEVSLPGSLTAFLLERYTAFTQRRRRPCFFRIWHPPWQQAALHLELDPRDDLLASTGNWWKNARYAGANYSPGVNVWMGWPHCVRSGVHIRAESQPRQ